MLHERLTAQLLTSHTPKDPVDIVRHFCSLQAQDWQQHLWALGLRSGCTKSDIEQAYNDGHLLRTWTQRGTIHTIATEEVRWMLDLCASRTLKGFARRREYLGISDALAHKVLDEIQRYLSGGKVATRKEIVAHVEKTLDITFGKGRGYHLTCYAGTLGLIAYGPLTDTGEHGYVALEGYGAYANLDTQEALVELTKRYFRSHGPATIDDVARWSGLTKTQLKEGIALCDNILHKHVIDGNTYYSSTTDLDPIPTGTCHILPGFDEFLLGYKDRSATVDDVHLSLIDKARNGVMKPTYMIDGRTQGIWTIKKKSKKREITIHPFDKITSQEKKGLEKAFVRYNDFVEQELVLEYN